MRRSVEALVDEEIRKERDGRRNLKGKLLQRPQPSLEAAKLLSSVDEVDAAEVDLEKSRGVGNERQRQRSRAASMAALFISTTMAPLKLMPTAIESPRIYQTARDRFNCIFDSSPARTLMIAVTLYSVYGASINELACEKTQDVIFTVFSSLTFLLFLAEVIVKCFGREGYLVLPSRQKLKMWLDSLAKEDSLLNKCKIASKINIGSFYFWLDLMATFSMMFELPWIFPAHTFQSITKKLSGTMLLESIEPGPEPSSLFNFARMIRLLRLVRLYKYFSQRKNEKRSATIVPDSADLELKNIPSESRVGSEMSDRTTKKAIIGVFVLVYALPFFQIEKEAYSKDLELRLVFKEWTTSLEADKSIVSSSRRNWKLSERHFLETSDCILLKYSIGLTEDNYYAQITPVRNISSSLRMIEKKTMILSDSTSSFSLTAEFDISTEIRNAAKLDILLATFIILLLSVGNLSFSHDVNNLVIIPIDKMVRLVREISVNPLGKDYSSSPEATSAGEGGAFETVLLLRTISKIASLMRVGFGEAGAEIIGRNLNMASAGKGGAGGIYATSMNLMGNGRKIQSVFAFCDIRNFTDTTECLQEEVMLFVNRIAHILHSVVVQCGGAANKNIGDAFLLTWKVDPAKMESGDPKAHGYVADKALLSLLKTFVGIISNSDFICNFAPSSLAALYERMPGYSCRIGCGLHFGWAIEGAIGTDRKIDASYISPHVNWSECLESWTKEYGVPLLMSEPFYRLLSTNASKHCRQVDRIKKSASDDVTSLYTYDANLNIDFPAEAALQIPHTEDVAPSTSEIINIMPKSTMAITRNVRRETAKSNRTVLSAEQPKIIISEFTVDVWQKDLDLIALRMHIDEECRKMWDEGIQEFLQGNWVSAVVHLKHVLDRLDGSDGPSQVILKYIEERGSVCPSDWPGYRDLYSRNDE